MNAGSPRLKTIARLVFALATLAFPFIARGGTLVFPPPDNATQCVSKQVPNACAVVSFNGGSFMTDSDGDPTFYGGGFDFPYCIGPDVQWQFQGALATEVSITIRNDSPVDGQSLSMAVTDWAGGTQTVTTTQRPFPKGQAVTLTANGEGISDITVTVLNSSLFPDWDHAAWAVTALSATQPVLPTIDLSVVRNGDGTYGAVMNYTFPPQSDPSDRTITLSLLPTKDEAGATYVTQTNLAVSGTLGQALGMLDTDRTLRALATACEGTATADASLTCTHCSGPAKSVGGPVQLFDGVMSYGETDPLPNTIGSEFRRSYSSGAVAAGWFGQGWTSIFDAGAVPVDASNGRISVVNEDRTRATFQLLTTGTWRQTWPVGGVAGILTGSETAGYTFRDAGGSIVRSFGTNHQLVRLQDLRHGLAVTITYDASGAPTRIFDEAGTWSCSVTTANGRITGVSVDGRPDLAWTYAYNGALLTSVSLNGAAGAWRTYQYSGNRLSAILDGNSAVIERHDYDAMGRATSSYDPSGDITAIQYPATDGSGVSTTSVTRADSSQATYQQAFSAGSVVTQHADGGCSACGSNDATAAYDASGNLWRLQNGRGYITESLYDATGRHLVQTTTALAPNGCDPATDGGHCRLSSSALSAATLAHTAASLTTTYVYADANWTAKPTRITRDSAIQPGGTASETFTYDAATGTALVHTMTGAIDIGGTQESHTTTTAVYDGTEGAAFNPGGAFQSAWLTLPQPGGERKSVDGPRTDVSDVTTLVYYPADASVPGAWRRRLAAARDALGHIARYEDYDVFGHAATVTDPNGVIMHSTFDGMGRLLTSTVAGVAGCNTTVDPLCATDLTTTRSYTATTGELASEQRPNGSTTTYAYDTRGRLQTLTRGTASTPLERIDYTYDPTTGKKATEVASAWQNGSWVAKKNESYTYTSDGQLSSTIHADTTRIVYAYLPDGTLSSVQDENHTTPNTSYAYDPANRLTATTQTLATAPGGQIVTRYTYDVRGNLISVTDPNGNVTAYVYDDFGRLQRQTSPVSGATTYTYDSAGNVLTTTDANGAVTTRTYDALNRATSSGSTRASATESVAWTYDDATGSNFGIGRLATVTDPTGSTVFQYERRGLLRSEGKTINGAPYTTAYTYDSNGNRSTLTYPSGLVAQYTSDFADRPYSLVAGTTTIVSSAAYLPFGPLTALVFGNGMTRSVTYDARYRTLENKFTSASGTIADYNYAEDNAGNVTQIHDATNGAYNRDFGYDDLNRLTTANSGASLWGAGSYSYDSMGNMLSSTLGSWRTTASAYSGTTPKLSSVVENGTARGVVYDAAGNETTVGTSAYAYTPRNSLASADTSSYAYDGRGLLTVAASALLAVNVAPASVTGSAVAIGTVTGSATSPSDRIVALSSNSSAVSVPATVTIPGGATSVSFNVTTAPVAADTLATLTASFSQSVATGSVTVLAPQLASVSLVPSAVTSGSATTGTVTLTGPAPTAFAIDLSSNNAAAAVPASVTVAQNASSATFTATTNAGTVNATATISATWAGVTQQATLSVSQAQMTGLTINPTVVQNGSSATGTVTLSPSGLTNTIVGLASSLPDAVVPSAVTVQAGAPSATFPIATALQTANTAQATITATLGNATQQATVRVNPPAIAGVTLTPATLDGGGRTIVTPSLTGPAPLSGMPVYLFLDAGCNLFESLVSVPGGGFVAGVVVPSQGSSAQTSMLTGAVASTSTYVVTASPNYQGDYTIGSQSAPLTVSPAAVTLSSLSLSPATVVGSNDVTGTVTLTANAPAAGLDVDLRSSNATAATLPTFVHVVGGQNTATFTIGTNLTAASVTISADHAAAVRTATLTVSGPPVRYPTGVAVAATLTGGTGATATLTLNSAPTTGSGVAVALSSSSPKLTVPSSVTVKKNTTSQTFTVTTTTVTTAVAAVITASYGGVITRTRVIVLPASGVAVTSVSVSPPSGIGMATFQGTVTLTSAAHTGGAVVTLGGSRTGMVTVPASVTVPAGQTSAAFSIQTFSYGAPKNPFGGTDVTASYGGVTVSTPLLLTPVLGCDATPASPRPVALCASLSLAPCLAPVTSLDRTLLANVVSSDPSRYYLYTPEMQLLAETEQSTNASKAIASSYLWFGGLPVASVDSSGTTRWYGTDHLGTPFLQTDAAGAVAWRAEYTPYGDIFTIRSGASLHQPLRLPGQVAQDGSNLYNNVFRWYRSGWGRYSQNDRFALLEPAYLYAQANPLLRTDPSGESSVSWGPVQTHLVSITDVYRECGVSVAGLKGCTRATGVRFNCNCHCAAPFAFFSRDISIVSQSLDVFYPNNAATDDFVNPGIVPPDAVLQEEMKHVVDMQARGRSLKDSLDQLEAVPYASLRACEKGCAAAADWVQRLFQSDAQHIDASHPRGYYAH
jgi:RHS repeat-associated protein